MKPRQSIASPPLLLATLALALIPVVARAGDWPQFLGPSRNGSSAEKNLVDKFPEAGPPVLWSAKLGAGYAGACVQGGKVYLLDRDANKGDVLHCWDVLTGKEDWQFAYDAPGKLQYDGSRSTPAVTDKHVFVVSPFGQVNCLDKASHAIVWSKHLVRDFGAQLPVWGFSQSPLLYKDSIILSPHGRQAGVVALDQGTGKVLWKTRSFGVTCYDSPMLTTIGNREMVLSLAAVNMNKSMVAGLDPAGGQVLWTYGGWGKMYPIPGPAHLGDGQVLLSGEYGAGLVLLHVEKPAAGGDYKVEELWNLSKTTTMASQIHQPFRVKEHIYFVSNGFDRADGLVCMDLAGKVVWKTGKAPHFDLGASLLADGKLFLLDGKSGILRIVLPDPSGYQELSAAKVLRKGPIWAPMALSDGKLLVRDQETLKCLDIQAK